MAAGPGLRRLTKELTDMQKEKLDNVFAEPSGDNKFHWNGWIKGPEGSNYEGGTFNLSIEFPPDYPFKPPKVIFTTPIYHPNVDEQGVVCLDILKDNWSAALTMVKVLLSLSSVLTDPNPAQSLRADVGKLYLEDRATYDANAKAHTAAHAMGK